jgi:hypothetical protein
MNRFFKTILPLTLLVLAVHFAMADRGVGKKNKTKVLLNIATPSSLRNSISFNLKSGLTYKGSLLAGQQTIGSSIMNSSIITYEKGNTIYIIPYKHTIVMPDSHAGYTGIKFIIQPK